MRVHSRHLLAALSIISVSCTPSSTTTTTATVPRVAMRDPAEDHFVDSLLALMTVDEKIGQLNQYSGVDSARGANSTFDAIRAGRVGSLFNVVGADNIRRVQRVAVQESRLHIPIVFGLDVIHGFRTEFPVPLGEAASWDPGAAQRDASIAASEASAAGVQWTFAPMVDIARDPRWGRIVEGAGEDPYLGSAFAVARTRGFQGPSLRTSYDHIAATVKHYGAYGAAEGGRDYNSVNLDERTLRDVYLVPYHAAVCAGVETIMSSFNDIAGVPAHANRWLQTTVLRDEWGFDGMNVSDWTGIGELINHGLGPDTMTVASRALNAGVDMDMVSQVYLHGLSAALSSGAVSRATLDEAVRRVLRFKYRLGLFTDPYRNASADRERTQILTNANRAQVRAAADESIVLLKNDGTLPLRKTVRTIAVIGALAADSGASVGNWNALGRAEDAVSVLTGIRRALPGATVRYVAGASPTSTDESGISAAVSAAQGADAVVLVIGEIPDMSAEAESRASIDVPGAQLALASALKATGVPMVVVLMNGRPLALQSLGDNANAMLESWFLGTEHGTAVADVLFGDVNPSGKLPVTFPRATGQIPIYYAHRNTGRPPDANNKYTSKYNDLPWDPMYAFGYGLSYTTFSYGTPQLSKSSMGVGDTLWVSTEVTNTGRVTGDEVVQMYVHDVAASVAPPVRLLKGFKRVHLNAGERKVVRFPIVASDLAFNDVNMKRIVEPGTFDVFVGGNSNATAWTTFQLTGVMRTEVKQSCSDLLSAGQ